ncbi:MAG: Xaa-Pro aminopeptidase [Gammaproteobacteria bacterium]|jgi:Xaa-Pro aminopeptidase
MYQWLSHASGTVQLSGDAPAWYRSTTPGPRVFVFDSGQLIDDTAVPVSEEYRQVLQTQAFGTADALDAEQTAPRNALRDALENAAHEGLDVSAVTEAFNEEQARSVEEEGVDVQQTVAELKALLDAWDIQHLDEAKALLRDAVGEAP